MHTYQHTVQTVLMAASVSPGQMLAANSVSLSCSFLSQFLRSQLSWPLPALLAELWLQGRTCPPLERLQALLMLEETRLWDVSHSLGSICCLGTNTPEFAD